MNWYRNLSNKLAKTGKQHVFRVGKTEHRVSTGTVAAWLVVCVVLSTACVGVVTTFSTSLTQVFETGYAAGSGTEAEPYIIDTPSQLVYLAQRTSEGARTRGVYYQLGSALDMTGVSMPPIGTADHPFEGVFNGSGLAVNGLNLFAPDMEYAGLFGVTGSHAAVRNLLLGDTGAVLGGPVTGAVAGLNRGLIENCENHLTVRGSAQVGGLVGRNEGQITSSGNFGPVTGAPAAEQPFGGAGGVVGCNTGVIQSCMSLGAVNAPSLAGGLVGSMEQGVLQNSYTASTVTAEAPMGGGVGRVSGGSVENCYFCLDLCALAGENDPSTPLPAQEMQQHSFLQRLNGTSHDEPSAAPQSSEAPQPSATPEASPTPTPESSATPEPSVTPDPSATPEPTVTPSASPEASATPLPSEEPVVTPEPTPAASPEVTTAPDPSTPPEATDTPASEPEPSAGSEAQPPQSQAANASPAGILGLFPLRVAPVTLRGAGSMIDLPDMDAQPADSVPDTDPAPTPLPEAQPSAEPAPTAEPQPTVLPEATAEPGTEPTGQPDAGAVPEPTQTPAEDGEGENDLAAWTPCEQDAPFYLQGEGTYPLLKYDWLEGVAIYRGAPAHIESWMDAAVQPAGGDGTEAFPYRIYTAGELAWLARQCLNGDGLAGAAFQLENDIDLSGGLWAPIGTAETPFAGVLLGGGHTVSGMNAAFPQVDDVGLFGVLAPTARVEALTVQGTAQGAARVGGIAGSSAGVIRRCQSHVSVSGVSLCGGVTGQNTGTLEYSAAYGLVSAEQTAGGLAGENSGAIRFAFNRGGVAAASQAGGLVGSQTETGSLSNSYTAAPVSEQAGGAALAANAGSLSRVYYCTDEGYTGPQNGLGEGYTLAAMQTEEFLQQLNAAE